MERTIILSWQFITVFIFLVAATLWDFRPYGQRLFDLIPLGTCALYLLVNWRNLPRLSKTEIFFGAYILFYCAYGYLIYQHRSSLVIALMFALFLLLRDKLPKALVDRGLKYIYISNLLIFFIQFGVYFATDYLIDFQELFGETSRVGRNGTVFRPVGLNSEPHNFCVSVTMLTLMTSHQKGMRFWHYLGCFAMLCSLSLWGMVVGTVLLLVIVTKDQQSLKEIARKFIYIFGLMIVGFCVLYGGVLQSQRTFYALGKRINILADDPSFKERFSQHSPQEKNLEKMGYHQTAVQEIEKVQVPAFVVKSLGKGLSTIIFVQGKAINGYFFIYQALGVVGIIVFAWALYLYWSTILMGTLYYKFGVFTIVGLLLSSYPMVSYAFFWIFLVTLLQKRPCLKPVEK